MILRKTQIDALVSTYGVIDKYDPDWIEHGTTKIDLRLGEKCYVSSQPEDIKALSDVNNTVTIEPNAIFMYQTYERVNIPQNIVGYTMLKMSQTEQGLLMANETQVEPGYNNHLFGMLYNLSNRPVTLTYKNAIVSLELHRLKKPVLATYSGKMGDMTLERFCTIRRKSSLEEIHKRFEEIKRDLDSQANSLSEQANLAKRHAKSAETNLSRLMSLVLVITLLVGLLAILVAWPRKTSLEVKLLEEIESRKIEISELRERVVTLESPNDSLVPPEQSECGVEQ